MSSLGTRLGGFQKRAGSCTEEKFPFFLVGNRNMIQDNMI